MRARWAFSLIELLTALVLLAVGLASYARAAGAVARLENDARLRRLVAASLQARLDTLRAEACGAARSGDSHQLGVHERWSVVPQGRHLLLTARVDVPGRPALARRLSAAITCRP
ncbi:MAG: prepilin-type N-terminal cleavage/methylation domain-containing protein [Gemmatimonadaceae bacterium]|nr:prepilin-type N-terminal cleavage/methylation domain-containing protein [Gemmatimonadaceae bacterium]